MKLELGKKIKTLRLEKGVTQEELANYLGVSYQAVSKWENDLNTPDIALLPKLSIFFGITIDELFKIPYADHFERIDNMLLNERIINHENFTYAQCYLQGLLEENATNSDALCRLAMLHNHRAQRDHELATDYAQKGLLYAPFNRSLHVRLIESLNGVTGDTPIDNHSEIITFYKDFTNSHPEYLVGYIILIEHLLADKRFDEAKEAIKQARKLEDRYVFYFYEGDIVLANGDKEKAIGIWNKAVIDFPNEWRSYQCRADRFAKLGMTDQAIKDCYKGYDIQEKPRLIDGLLLLAEIYEQLGQYNDAIKMWEATITAKQEDYGITSGELIDQPLRQIERLRHLL